MELTKLTDHVNAYSLSRWLQYSLKNSTALRDVLFISISVASLPLLVLKLRFFAPALDVLRVVWVTLLNTHPFNRSLVFTSLSAALSQTVKCHRASYAHSRYLSQKLLGKQSLRGTTCFTLCVYFLPMEIVMCV